ncbi:BAHD acyltransferase DCR [Triticum urartu]|uniref:BAHD acyltransferase DCR n=1 Tax=Triticum urartu TaxID=4572 RepID=M8AC51_TRIUA|nr:BAHD acyltransferase DCR [Triticum urartu]
MAVNSGDAAAMAVAVTATRTVAPAKTKEGAEVVEAAAEGVSVDQLAGEDCGEEAEKLMQQLIPYTGVMNLEGLHRPLLAVQFTKLKDGLAVGCAFNHAVLDGTATWHFMSSWAELCRGAAAPSALPIHNRAMARSVRVGLTLPASAEAHEKTDPNGPKKPLVARVFSFPEPVVARIKANANAALPPGAKPFSAFQSLGAHIWRSVSRARELGPADITVFAVFADCRARLDPPVPATGGNNKFDGMVYLYPGRGGDSGGIDVELALQPEPMQRLEKDEEFLQIAAA